MEPFRIVLIDGDTVGPELIRQVRKILSVFSSSGRLDCQIVSGEAGVSALKNMELLCLRTPSRCLHRPVQSFLATSETGSSPLQSLNGQNMRSYICANYIMSVPISALCS